MWQSSVCARRILWLSLLTVWFNGCSPADSTTTSTARNASGHSPDEQQIVEFCSRCHQPPDPASFARDRWVHEVYRGYGFFAQSDSKGETKPPEKNRAIEYFTSRAPVALASPEPVVYAAEEQPRFRMMQAYSPTPQTYPMTAHLSWKKWSDDDPERIVVTDLHAGTISYWDPQNTAFHKLGSVSHPAQIEWCDIDHDGLMDLLVADLGSVEPKDHTLGSVTLFRQKSDGSWKPVVLASGLGRVCEIRTADFNHDQRWDIVVAEFGWQKSGSITLLEQRPSTDETLKFQRIRLDGRHGSIRVPPLDLDQDGDIDFVALIAQEHEAVDIFVNRGDGRFDARRLCPPREPAFGSNGLEPADLDGDGDIDFVVSNGDMFDSFMIKPYHQLRWLENKGELNFVEHHLAFLPGVHGAAMGDLDLDGDLDIVTSSCFPLRVVKELGPDRIAQIASAVWFEQVEPGQFVPHRLESGNPLHACQMLADVDADGDLDVVLGMFGPDAATPQPAFVVYENLTRSSNSNAETSTE